MERRGRKALPHHPMTTKTIMFTRNTDLQTEGAEFAAGDTKELPLASAERWLKRNAAIEVPKVEKKAEKPAPAPEPEPEAPRATLHAKK